MQYPAFRGIIRKKNEANTELKQYERKQMRKFIIKEDIDIGRFFQIATTNKKHVNGLFLQEIKYEILLEYRGDFE